MTTTSVRVARTSSVSTFHPLRYNDKATGEYLNRLFSHLVVTDQHGRLVPGSIVRRSHPGPQRAGRRRHRFTLHDTRWHDGGEVRAHDVAFTLEAVLDPAFDSPKLPEIRSMGDDLEVTVVDDRTVEVAFEPGGTGIAGLAWLPILPERHYGRTTPPRPIGSGEFVHRSGVPGDRTLVMERNDAHASPSRLPRIEWHQCATADEALASVLAGAMTLAPNVPPGIAPGPGRSDAVVHRSFDGTTAYLAFNLRRSPLSDPRVRQAMDLAIDRQEIVDEVLRGFGCVATSLVPDAADPGDPSRTRRNVAAARRLLADAGWSGAELRLTLRTVRTDAVKVAAAETVARQLADVAVDVRVETSEMPELLQRHLYPGEYELALLALSSGPVPTFLRAFYHSRGAGSGNRFGLTDTDVDRAIENLPGYAPVDLAASEEVGAVLGAVERARPHVPLFHPEVLDVALPELVLPPLPGMFVSRYTDMHRWQVAA